MKSIVLILVLAMGIVGCDRKAGDTEAPADTQGPSAPTAEVSKLPRVVFLGDSLTAGYGVDADQAFPALIGEALRKEGTPIDVVNAGQSGDTTAGGLRRAEWVLKQKPDIVVVGLGGNDALRGQDLASSEQNLRAIVEKCRAAGADVVLLGMLIPPNYGPEYTGKFKDIYPRVAKELNVALVPFLLEGVGGDAKLNQPDGIHPTAEGHQRVAANVLPTLRALLKRRADRSSTQPTKQASQRRLIETAAPHARRGRWA
jgi:acyl-CoA thioesterase-1